jgi:MbtH protein
MDAERDEPSAYRVVRNDAGQYSIWPVARENAVGWQDAGPTGTKSECLAHIEQVWTDVTPRRAVDA